MKKDLKAAKEFKFDLKAFIADSKAGLIATEDVIYVSCLLTIGVIDAFQKGKITRERMEKLLYSSKSLPTLEDPNG